MVRITIGMVRKKTGMDVGWDGISKENRFY